MARIKPKSIFNSYTKGVCVVLVLPFVLVTYVAIFGLFISFIYDDSAIYIRVISHPMTYFVAVVFVVMSLLTLLKDQNDI